MVLWQFTILEHESSARIYVFSSCCGQLFLTDSAMLLLARGKEKYL
jgi:hypothetical protein